MFHVLFHFCLNDLIFLKGIKNICCQVVIADVGMALLTEGLPFLWVGLGQGRLPGTFETFQLMRTVRTEIFGFRAILVTMAINEDFFNCTHIRTTPVKMSFQ